MGATMKIWAMRARLLAVLATAALSNHHGVFAETAATRTNDQGTVAIRRPAATLARFTETEISTELPTPPDYPAIGRTPALVEAPQMAILTDEFSVGIAKHLELKLTGIDLDKTSGELTITGTTSNDSAELSLQTKGTVRVTLNFKSQSFAKADVKKVVFAGKEGDDTFTNTTSIPSTIYGNDGNDILKGGAGNDFIVGGYGQDTIYGEGGDDVLWGSGGSDKIFGGDGRDTLMGHGGNDELHAGPGRDYVNGGSGDDQLFGDAGQDLLVSVGLGRDILAGGAQWDNYWIDSTDSITDPSPDETKLGYVHKVTAFRIIGSDGSVSVTHSLQIGNDELTDPTVHKTDQGYTIDGYADHPLFPMAGPGKDDIFQGAIGDCYFLAWLSAVADAEPEFIRRAVAPLGDGTYVVRFKRDGADDYVRVDGDLWTKTNGLETYAKVGQEGALWGPIIEKAFAVARRDEGTYKSIAGGNGTTLSAIGGIKDTYGINDGIAPQDVVDWYNNGQPDGAIKDAVRDGTMTLLNWIKQQRGAGTPLVTGARSGVQNATQIRLDDPNTDGNESTYRRGQHIYMVDHVTTDAKGTPTGLVLRNPYGSYDTISDFTRIYFCIGRATIVEVWS